MERHTYQTGLIGNCAFLAHINKNTNIDWLCWPRMDSSFVFGGLLDKKNGGSFSVLPEADFSSHQYYLENTNVLCTEITTTEGSYRVTDFAPRFLQYERFFKPLMLIRKVEPLEGSPRIQVKCEPTCDYGASKLRPMRGSSHIEFTGCEENIRLTTNIPVSYLIDGEFFVLNDTRYLILTYGHPLEAPLASTAERFLRETISYWRTWIKHSSIANYFQPYVIRSALALKIHQYEDTGAIIAASTTSLPEFPESGRNWDYRYCWMRDTYYIITALNHIGHFEEMERYFGYITDISFSGDFRYQPLYGITGQKTLSETILPHLDGYMGNKPVRIGNQAFEHIQNDIYGQVLISMLPLYTDHRFIFSERKDSDRWIELLLKKIEKTIDEKDAGIWEFRNMANVHCYTNLFQWAGCAAAEKMARTIGNESLLEQAIALKNRAAAHIESCYDPVRKVYTNAAGSQHLDASTLQLIMMNYLDPASERARDHLIALEKELKTPEGLFYRYRHSDDFGKPKTTFLVCAFWYVEALACVGRLEDAQREFGKLLQYSNHLLLFSEDVESDTGSQWGNFPQAYSHVGLMNAAYRIAMKLDTPIFL
ncbi:Glucoamylase (glucan-1,4-alpha-glucosidase), GH15 family [Chitinophaga ginsengisegetis]|uniref:Glucoamylase (Glucan-1,4-alpha-glucosidase), GH15 family n=1 Tax=Chitinophaga ginsengisegetis TaxID=393003 RepID=A0A1T5P7H3_9BACT|nr:glycoside hydrolase family 15 protein [Chitinophaga ginsengisegetis]MDR6567754.1 GH15 family glucan-1,4-alpha-glucosidase [Chitinophaga ginsengisegetis]MDR6647691.1 GH15 family glucan-1,4-alpha-glucosidase [Chitinophaga ginsengisegetis]MDR6654041.1 GH15 family glucan-1,4-alpha-glucosidase [Chitinophaga ginsengisegetis]SKD08714.1 Glucoamylase (glucan-1,4-alpha-glucosidase), GH15 family [Chitinophaga ginsengisegetis]